ncbi:MAG: glycerol-3-phosphate 1-O-acyltransferase [Deltaproteobacteria bacterium]|nr:glycerol-3-phosphate 1-O-acyltransferase [Deltaproteobacteria bacterium]
MAHPATIEKDPFGEPVWPAAVAERPGERVVFLVDAASALEKRHLEAWIHRRRPAELDPSRSEVVAIPSSRGRRGRRPPLGALESAIAAGGDPLLVPLRVAWFAASSEGIRTMRAFDIVTMGDPRDPGRLRQRYILTLHPNRCRIVVGEPARLGDLRRRWSAAGGTDVGETTGLSEFIARQATLALERAERRMRGARYKVPRLVEEDILSRPAFRGGAARLARELGADQAKVATEAAGYLREIAATHDTFVIDILAYVIRLLYTRGYGENIHYDKARLEEIYSLAQRHPVVFLPTHKSNLDHLVLQYTLYENGHPPNHTAGGINMNFFPVGPLVRRAGVFFIRRTFKDNETYKFVLRHYIDYLIEKRFSLEWYVEGGRSRSGKMLPPHFGMLAYVVDAWRRGKSEDVVLLPVSIAYDQIQDVGEYVAEQHGSAKESESFGWFLRVVRRLRRRYGDIYIKFGEPLSLRETLPARGQTERDGESEVDVRSLDLQKLAFEVCVRINRATPITPTSLVTLALLGVGDRAATVEEVAARLQNMVKYVARRRLPVTEPLDLGTSDSVRRVLDHLVENDIVSCFAEGPEAVYMIRSDEFLTAAYYRNTVIHFFVGGAIAELAVVAAAESPGEGDRLEVFWAQALALRDLLKFEFFFPERSAFVSELGDEMTLHESAWQGKLRAGGKEIEALLLEIKPLNAHRVLRPFLEAYRVVADLLARRDPADKLDEGRFLSQCLALGKQYQLQRRIMRAESVSKVLFQTALRLAGNRGLLDAGPGGQLTELAEKRKTFAAELGTAIRRIDAIEALALSRATGLLGRRAV